MRRAGLAALPVLWSHAGSHAYDAKVVVPVYLLGPPINATARRAPGSGSLPRYACR
ncbi:MAG: hypothetical protein H0U35_10455 [Sporichthyaceae bacterium]|nr:hypothetical protein [Sporichthyaceae bacterium]